MNYIEQIQETNKALIDLADKLLRKEVNLTEAMKREIDITMQSLDLIMIIIKKNKLKI